jgi:hypothetical protein
MFYPVQTEPSPAGLARKYAKEFNTIFCAAAPGVARQLSLANAEGYAQTSDFLLADKRYVNTCDLQTSDQWMGSKA